MSNLWFIAYTSTLEYLGETDRYVFSYRDRLYLVKCGFKYVYCEPVSSAYPHFCACRQLTRHVRNLTRNPAKEDTLVGYLDILDLKCYFCCLSGYWYALLNSGMRFKGIEFGYMPINTSDIANAERIEAIYGADRCDMPAFCVCCRNLHFYICCTFKLQSLYSMPDTQYIYFHLFSFLSSVPSSIADGVDNSSKVSFELQNFPVMNSKLAKIPVSSYVMPVWPVLIHPWF